MRTVKRNFLIAVCAVLGGLVLIGGAQADPTSDTPAGLVVFPEIAAGSGFDTVIQLSNTSNELINVRCYWVNANGHCTNAPAQVCSSDSECNGGICAPGWTETDFRFTLTRNQPIAWVVSEGLPGTEFPLDGLERITQDGQFNADSSIPPAPETPFTGELKCFEVDSADNPVARNDLKGEATIVDTTDSPLDVSKYNGIGLRSTGFNDGNDTLCLGGQPTDECPEAEYEGCPNVVIVDHYFDGIEPVNGDGVSTDLFIVPCSQDFLNQTTFKTTVQFLVFNEFEQRLSTSIRIQCYEQITLSDIDTRSGDTGDDIYSIFNVAVQGTLTGQSRLRAVQTNETQIGHGILVTAEELHYDGQDHYASFNVDYAGRRNQADIIRAPRQ